MISRANFAPLYEHPKLEQNESRCQVIDLRILFWENERRIMPRRRLLTPTEYESLLALPTDKADLVRYYAFDEKELAVIRQHRGDQNRLGFAVQLCYLRYHGMALPTNIQPPKGLLDIVAKQISVNPEFWLQYAQREETRREHLLELQSWMKLTPFSLQHYKQFLNTLTELAQQTDKGVVLATSLLESLRQQHIIVPPVDVIARICAEALTKGTKRVHGALTKFLSPQHQLALDGLLVMKENTKVSLLSWLRQPSGMPNAKHVLMHIERLRFIDALGCIRNGRVQAARPNFETISSP